MTERHDQSRQFILQAMVSMAEADEALDDAETATICRIYEQVTAQAITAADVREEAEGRRTSETRLAAELKAACSEIDKATKENIIRAAYLVLLADGRIAARERKKLKDFAAALKIPEIHYTMILEDLESWSR